MKTRQGFVSNSSSSSFVLITSKANHEKAMAALDEWERKVIGSVVEEFDLDGIKVIKFHDYSEEDSATVYDIMESQVEGFEMYTDGGACDVFDKCCESEEHAVEDIRSTLWKYRSEARKGKCVTHHENH